MGNTLTVIPLASKGIAHNLTLDVIGRVAFKNVPSAERPDTVRIVTASNETSDLDGYAAVVTEQDALSAAFGLPHITQCSTGHLANGDIVMINPRGYMRTLIRHGSPSNSLFATDRCSSLCLMCSQPPKDVDDSGKVDELLRTVRLMDPGTIALGITGGEPTLLGDGLIEVIRTCRDRLPTTSLHLLSNGRRFWYGAYAKALGEVKHPDLMVGIPLYADVDSLHDYVVQAKGAFDETVIGLQNLGNYGVPVEIRIVIQKHTAARLDELAEFIYRNFTFASHIAFMGLEITGYAKGNLENLWINAEDYVPQLKRAVTRLSRAGMAVSIYNHQLCRLPQTLWGFCRQSISDWKNDYAADCQPCSVKTQCGGFFSWNLAHPQANVVYPIKADQLAQ